MRPYEFINSLRERTSWEQRSMWRTYVWDIGGMSEEERDSLQERILKEFNQDSEDLACMHTYWYPTGALKQSKLDKEVHNMLFLLHHHTRIY